MPTTLYASIDGRVSPLANQEVIFHDPLREQTHVMTTQVLQALDLCRPFRTLDQHVGALAAALQGLAGREDAIRRVLESLVTRGLLVSDESWVEHLGRGGQREAAPFAGIFIRASGSPDSLKVLLDSLLAYEEAFAPGHRYVLIDDGGDASIAATRRHLMEAFARSAEVKAACIDAQAWSRIAGLLEDMTPGARETGLLLRRDAGGGDGALLNLVALLSAGQRSMLVDDHTRLPFHRHGQVQRGLDLAARVPTAFALFPSAAAALADGETFDDDPLQLHLRSCGAALGDLVNRVPGFELRREDLHGLEPSRLLHLRAGSRILGTSAGIRGPVTPGPWLFQLDSASRAAFSDDRDHYLRVLAEPAVRRVSTCIQLQAAGVLDALMLDHSEPVPCAPDAGDAAERARANLWRVMYPDALSAQIPVTLGRVGTRHDDTWLKKPVTPPSNAFLADAIARASEEIRADDPWARMHAVGARLDDLASASDAALRNELREYLAFARSGLIQSLQQVYETQAASAPVHWQADLRQLIETNGRALIDAGEARLADAAAPTRGEVSLRATLRRQTAAMAVWPGLWKAAHERNEKLWKQI